MQVRFVFVGLFNKNMKNGKIHKELLEDLESLFVWEEPRASNFFNAFISNCRLLDILIYSIHEVVEEEELPRVTYFKYTQNLSLAYVQLSITIECLLKMLIDEADCKVEHTYKLLELIDEVLLIDNEKAKEICALLLKHKDMLQYFDDNKVFINYRYADNLNNLESVEIIKDLILVVDDSYEKYYVWFDYIDLTYDVDGG